MDNKELVKLNVLGITYRQIQEGAYALILSEADGNRRIPVVIGASEAQSIAARIEKVQLPRPLVHDVMKSMMRAFGIILKEVIIYKFEKGVFYSELVLSDGEREVRIDSRTSDAIAIAMRTDSPIYTTHDIVETTGFVTGSGDDSAKKRYESQAEDPLSAMQKMPLERFAVSELEKMLAASVRKEDYERAEQISEVLKQKRNVPDGDGNTDKDDAAAGDNTPES